MRNLLFATLTLLMTLTFFPRPAAAAGLTPNDVARIESVGSAAISPDGQAIAYVRSVPRRPYQDEDGPSWGELWVSRGGEVRPYVTGEVSVNDLGWTPDGQHVTFLAKRKGDKETALYAIALAGGEARKLLEHPTGIGDYTFSPDGKRVAFLAEEEQKDKESLKEKGFKAEVFEEDRAFTRVWIAPLGVSSGGEAAKPRQLPLEGQASELHWSPVDDRLVVAIAPTPMIDDNYMKRRVHVVDAGSGKVLASLDNVGKLGDVVWSPDGKNLAVISGEDLNDPSPSRLMLASASGGALKDLMPGYLGQVGGVSWLDASTLVVLGEEGLETRVYTLAIQSGAKPKVVLDERICWSGLSLSRQGGHLALVGDTPRFPDELFRMTLSGNGGGETTRLTESNPWLAEKELGEQEGISYHARDGEKIEAVLILPVGRQAGQRYPLIVYVHGGPEAHYCNGWMTGYSGPGQMAAAKGMAVLAPNYRGSTGRGVAFAKQHQGDFAGKEFDDLVDGVDHLIAMGLVDGEKVGITGGSYGGFASAWGATYYTERFAAAVMSVGISNQISKFGTSDIPNEMYLVHQRMYPWENRQFMLERSPIFYVEQARTPILILHGKDDTRVNPGQSMELYRSLETLGQVPVRLVLYPGEGHGNRKAGARYDFSLRMMRWFEHYLLGDGGEPPPFAIDYPAQLGLAKEAMEGEGEKSAQAESAAE